MLIVQRLDSMSHTIFSLLDNSDSVPQTFAKGVITEAQTFQQDCCFSIVRASYATKIETA